MKQKIIQIFGWYGAVAILIAFFLVSFSYILPTSFLYLFLSLSGAVGIALNAFMDKDYPATFLNIIYALVAVLAFIKIMLLR